MGSLLVIVAILAVAIFYFIGLYNGLVGLRNRVKNSFSQIDVQLKRRYELIPNLVESTKAYMSHERQTLEAVIAARNQALMAYKAASADPSKGDNMKSLIKAEGVLESSMGKFMAVMESYPDLKANQTMQVLMEELSSTENKVAFSRQGYNDSVMSYNTAREKFPAVMFAATMGFGSAEPFEISNPVEREAVRVSFK